MRASGLGWGWAPGRRWCPGRAVENAAALVCLADVVACTRSPPAAEVEALEHVGTRARHVPCSSARLDDAGYEPGAVEQRRPVGGCDARYLRREQRGARLRSAPDELALADDEPAAGRVAGNRDALADGGAGGADPEHVCARRGLAEADGGEVGGRLLHAGRSERRPVLCDDAAPVDGHDGGAGVVEDPACRHHDGLADHEAGALGELAPLAGVGAHLGDTRSGDGVARRRGCGRCDGIRPGRGNECAHDCRSGRRGGLEST